MPHLVTLRITTRIAHLDFAYSNIPHITRITPPTLDWLGASNPVHFTSAIRSGRLTLASSFYGPLGECHLDTLPKLQNLHNLILHGQMPEFVLRLPELKTISFNLKFDNVPTTRYPDPLMPSRAPVYDTITSVTICLDKNFNSFWGLDGTEILPYMTRFIQKLKNLRQVKILFESLEYSIKHFPVWNFIRDHYRTRLPRTMPYKILKSYAQLETNSRFPVTKHATIPEFVLVTLVFWGARILDDASWFPTLHSLTICSAAHISGYILTDILQLRKSWFSSLRLLTIQYRKESRLLDEQATGMFAAEREKHQDLCISIEQCGINVVREYESDEAHSYPLSNSTTSNDCGTHSTNATC